MALSKQASSQVKERQDMDDEQRQRKHIAEQIERARQLEEEKAAKREENNGEEDSGKSAGEDKKPSGPISISIGLKKDSPPPLMPGEDKIEDVQTVASSSESAPPVAIVAAPIKLNVFKKANPLKSNPLKAPKTHVADKKTSVHSLTAVEQLMKEDQERKRRREQTDTRERYGPSLKR